MYSSMAWVLCTVHKLIQSKVMPVALQCLSDLDFKFNFYTHMNKNLKNLRWREIHLKKEGLNNKRLQNFIQTFKGETNKKVHVDNTSEAI